MLSQSEISNDTIIVILLLEQYIFRLKISMHNLIFMHNLKSFKNTLQDHFDLDCGKFMLVFNFIVELSTL